MNWIQIKAACTPEAVDDVAAVMTVIDSHLMIDDSSDITERNLMYGELIDESLLGRNDASVSFYISEKQNANEIVAYLRDRFGALGLDVNVTLEGINEEDWADNWKKYYHPIRIGKRIVIVPEWEADTYKAEKDDIIVTMDPGMAFGTGTHESTQLCAALLEEEVAGGETLVDVGTGSGILAICAAKLGVVHADAYDIDDVAVKIAAENTEKNGTADKIHCEVSDLLANVHGEYDIMIANITAEIILRMAPDAAKNVKKGGRVIMSGIIDPSCETVVEAMTKYGFKLVKELHLNDWSGVKFIKE